MAVPSPTCNKVYLCLKENTRDIHPFNRQKPQYYNYNNEIPACDKRRVC